MRTTTDTGLLQDTLGRSITMSSSSGGGMTTNSYTVHDSDGTARHYNLNYTDAHAVYNPVENTSQYISVLSSIDLPNSTSYTFTYAHDQGFLTRIDLPAGGYISFDYAGGNSSHNLADNYVVQRHVYDGEDSWNKAGVEW